MIRSARAFSALWLVALAPGCGGSAATPVAEARPLGLANLRERLAQLYGAGQRLTLLPVASGGTEVHVELPLRLPAAEGGPAP